MTLRIGLGGGGGGRASFATGRTTLIDVASGAGFSGITIGSSSAHDGTKGPTVWNADMVPVAKPAGYPAGLVGVTPSGSSPDWLTAVNPRWLGRRSAATNVIQNSTPQSYSGFTVASATAWMPGAAPKAFTDVGGGGLSLDTFTGVTSAIFVVIVECASAAGAFYIGLDAAGSWVRFFSVAWADQAVGELAGSPTNNAAEVTLLSASGPNGGKLIMVKLRSTSLTSGTTHRHYLYPSAGGATPPTVIHHVECRAGTTKWDAPIQSSGGTQTRAAETATLTTAALGTAFGASAVLDLADGALGADADVLTSGSAVMRLLSAGTLRAVDAGGSGTGTATVDALADQVLVVTSNDQYGVVAVNDTIEPIRVTDWSTLTTWTIGLDIPIRAIAFWPERKLSDPDIAANELFF